MSDTVTISRRTAEFCLEQMKAPGGSYSMAALTELEAALRSDDGWTTVDEQHPLPDDLKVGDEVQFTDQGRCQAPITGICQQHERCYKAGGYFLTGSITAFRRRSEGGG